MIYVEDLLLAIAARMRTGWPLASDAFDGWLDDWSRDFITSVSGQIMVGKPLSTNQSQVILKLVARVRRQIVCENLASDAVIDRLLRQPEFRRTPYASGIVPREVRHLGDNLLGFRFKQNEAIVARIRQLGVYEDWAGFRISEPLPRPQFNWEYHIWLVPVMGHSYAALMRLINEYGFQIDEPARRYLQLARQSRDKASVLALRDGVIVANVCDNPMLAGWITSVADGLVL